jgi:hypothetical protein
MAGVGWRHVFRELVVVDEYLAYLRLGLISVEGL